MFKNPQLNQTLKRMQSLPLLTASSLRDTTDNTLHTPRVLITILGLVLSSDNTYPLRHTSVNILTKYLSILISCPNVSHSAQRYLVFVFLLLVQFYYNMFTVVAALKSAHGDIVCIRLNLHCKMFPIVEGSAPKRLLS